MIIITHTELERKGRRCAKKFIFLDVIFTTAPELVFIIVSLLLTRTLKHSEVQ